MTERRDSQPRAPVALVTGGGRGIGRAICEDLARSGMAVAVVARSEVEIEAVADAIRGTGREAIAVTADATKEDSVASAVAEVERSLGPIDLLVNTAGGGTSIGPIWEANPAEWWEDIELNLLSVFLFCRQVVPQMIERRAGRIVNFSTYYAYHPHPYYSAYSCSKAAVTSLTESLGDMLRQHSISVFAVDPALVQTRLEEFIRTSELGMKWLPEFLEFGPQDYTPASAVASLVTELASGAADRLSGRCIRVLSDVKALSARAEEIAHDELYLLRLNKLTGLDDGPRPVGTVAKALATEVSKSKSQGRKRNS